MNLSDVLASTDQALADVYEANAREPYSDSRYAQASETLDAWLFILCGDHWIARDVRDMMMDCFHESDVTERMIVLYMSEAAGDAVRSVDGGASTRSAVSSSS